MDVSDCEKEPKRQDDFEEPEKEPERDRFKNRLEFLLYCVGYAVGIGDVWRFPFLAYQNGGGAFVLAYFILMILIGIPMYTMELAVGQFSSLGPIAVWKALPIGKGIGIAMVVISVSVSIYYNVILCYTLFYLGQSFRAVLPWSDCYSWWGADSNCYVRTQDTIFCKDVDGILARNYSTNATINTVVVHALNGTSSHVSRGIYEAFHSNCSNGTQTASEQFWEKYVLGLSPGIEEVGYLRWELVICLFVSWVIVFFCLVRGVESSGKVVYFTATFPYVVIFILLVRGVTLSGASIGLKYLLIPDFAKLADVNLWRAATEQLFYSISIGWGGLIMSGSYNNFRTKIHIDAIIVTFADFLTCLLGGIAVFSVLGNMAQELQVDIGHVANAGQGLAFVVYPEALTKFWCPQLWSVTFFVMLYLLGIDSEFPLLQTFITIVTDAFPKTSKYKGWLAFLSCSVCFLLGLLCITQGGQYVLNLMDTYSAGVSLVFVGACEVVALMWAYGYKRFSRDMKFMLGSTPSILFRISWAVVCPVGISILFIYGTAMSKPVLYNNTEPYPTWANGVGWLLALLSMGQVPIWAVIALIRHRKNLKKAFAPDPTWGPADPKLFKAYHEELSAAEEVRLQSLRRRQL